jgi:hypothetical protein
MVTAIVGLVGAAAAAVAWYAGYHVGRSDGRCGVCQCWPWSAVTYDREED